MLLFVILCIDLTFPNIARLLLSVKKLPSAARLARIRERFASEAGVSVADLAREFGVSEMTIRRDLSQLEGQSHIHRTHGGAVLTGRMLLEFDYRDRREANREAKQAIAREARKLVKPGQRLILDNGTTTLELACLLRDGENLTVITPSLAVASELLDAPGVEVILLGGVIRRGSPDLTGPVTEHCLELFSADITFQGTDGIGLDGKLYNADLRLARVEKHMRRIARTLDRARRSHQDRPHRPRLLGQTFRHRHPDHRPGRIRRGASALVQARRANRHRLILSNMIANSTFKTLEWGRVDLSRVPHVPVPAPGPQSRHWHDRCTKHFKGLSGQVKLFPVSFESGKGCVLRDVDGNDYIDFPRASTSPRSATVTRRSARASRALRHQLMNAHDFTTPIKTELMEKLASVLPGDLNGFQLYDSGTAAVEAGIRVLRAATGKHETVSCFYDFHGKTYGAVSLGHIRSHVYGAVRAPGAHMVPRPTPIVPSGPSPMARSTPMPTCGFTLNTSTRPPSAPSPASSSSPSKAGAAPSCRRTISSRS
jgi:DeoR/GlpR family transcriptional regulator of sugar metabolism